MLSLLKKLPVYMVLLFSIPAAAQTHLDSYLSEALRQNQGLQKQNIQLEKSLTALKEARSYFLPEVRLIADYTKADGGRTIDMPVGDMLNPVYKTLNQLTESNSFPQISNQSFQLNPDNFYDAKFRTSLALINAEIWYNKQIRKELITQQRAAVNVYKRELVKDVRTAYYRYYQADKAVVIYQHARSLVQENIRVNESLVRNGVRNSTALTRSKAEKEKIEAQLAQAAGIKKNAQAWFNFLLNQPLDRTIELDSLVFDPGTISTNVSAAEREELVQLKAARSALTTGRKLQQSYLMPKIGTFLDLGSQGFDWKFDNQSRYYLWGINLQWDLFSGGRHTARTRQATLDLQTYELQLDETGRALALQLQQAGNNYSAALTSWYSSEAQLSLATKYYEDQLKVYKEGQLLYIELLDAQNQLTGARLQNSVAFADVMVAAAELERCTAGYPINTTN